MNNVILLYKKCNIIIIMEKNQIYVLIECIINFNFNVNKMYFIEVIV